jgi:hypothetical protein
MWKGPVFCVLQGSSVSNHCGDRLLDALVCGAVWSCNLAAIQNGIMIVTVTVTVTFGTLSCLIALVVGGTTFDMVLRGVFLAPYCCAATD